MVYQKTVFYRIQAEIKDIGRHEAIKRVTVYMKALYSSDLDGKLYFYEQDRDGLPLKKIETRLPNEQPFDSTVLARNFLDARAWSTIPGPRCFEGGCWPPVVRADLLGCKTLTEMCAECDPNNLHNDSRDADYLDWVERMFQLWHENIDIRFAEHTGYGLYARNAIPTKCYIGEYTGIILPFDRKLRDDQCVYQFSLNIGKLQTGARASQPWCWIDGTKKGSIFRFLAHSCEPNAAVAQARIGSYNRVLAVYSTNVITPGEAISIDYGPEWFRTRGQPCYCGTKRCRNPPRSGDDSSVSDSSSEYEG